MKRLLPTLLASTALALVPGAPRARTLTGPGATSSGKCAASGATTKPCVPIVATLVPLPTTATDLVALLGAFGGDGTCGSLSGPYTCESTGIDGPRYPASGLIESVSGGPTQAVVGAADRAPTDLGPYGFASPAGIVGDASTDETGALNARLAGAGMGGVVDLPCGYFKVTGALTANISAGQQLTLKGSGFCTVLAVQGANGPTFNYGSPYSGLLLTDMILTTNSAGGHTAVTLRQTAANPNPALSGQTTVRDVAMMGDDGGSAQPAHYWGVGIDQAGVSNVNIDNWTYLGAHQSGLGFTGSGISATSPAVETNFENTTIYGCDTGIQYPVNYQGMVVLNPNITYCHVGVSVPAAVTKVGAELTILGGQMANTVFDVQCATKARFQNLLVADVYLIIFGNVQGIQVCGTGAKIADNQIITPSSTGGAVGIRVTTSGPIPADIHDNSISYANYGIFFDPNVIAPTPGDVVAWVRNNNVFHSSKFDYFVNATDRGVVIDDEMGRPYAKLPQCNQSIRGSRFLITDGAARPRYLGAAAGGGHLTQSILCNGNAYVND